MKKSVIIIMLFVIIFTLGACEMPVVCNHSWENATCTNPKICSLCGITQGKALGHKEVIDQAVSVTCSSDGLTQGRHCSRCGFIIQAQTIIQSSGHSISHGSCTVCHTITDAYDALAYYVLSNGQVSDNGDYCIIIPEYYDESESYFFIYTNSIAKTLSFQEIYISKNGSTTFIKLNLNKSNNVVDASMIFDYEGYMDYMFGKIYKNSFSSLNMNVVDYRYSGDFPASASNFKTTFARQIHLLIDGIKTFVLPEIDIDITMSSLGFINY